MFFSLVFFLLINEINYHSSDSLDSWDWIELYNNGPEAVVLSGWRFQDGNDDHQFIFPAGLKLEPGKYLVLCQDTLAFSNIHGTWMRPIGNFSFGLKNSGEMLRLYNASGVLVNAVRYGDDPPWPTEPDGLGLTLELANPGWDNTDPLNWRSSLVRGGTPGYQNSALTKVAMVRSLPGLCRLEQNYPNPFNETTVISYTLEQPGQILLAVYTTLGQQTAKLVEGYQDKGSYAVHWDGRDMPGGIYFVVLYAREHCLRQKMILMR
jgi:hypothetical protein